MLNDAAPPLTTLLGPTEAICAGRIRLTHLTDDHLAAMPWLETALAPDWTPAELGAARTTAHGLLISDLDGAALGTILLRPAYPLPGDAAILFIAVQPERRYRGLGGEAGLAAERLARERLGVRRVFAGVPEGRGLAVYFWLRLGFRPLSLAEAPAAPLGLTANGLPGIWMLRDGP